MKFTLLLLSILALASTSLAVKSALCGQQPFQIGMCEALIPRYTYVASTNECVRFDYGGCGGNNNNFATKSLCEAYCKL